MFSKSYSAVNLGIDGCIVNVEADISDGLPIFDMVGFLGSEVKEARERVRISLKNAGYRIPSKRITINLSPADVRKEGTAFDLPIAIAILSSLGFISQEKLNKTLIVGELSLDGKVNRVSGVLPMVYAASKKGFEICMVPKENEKEGAVVRGLRVVGITRLSEAVEYLSGRITLIEASFSEEDFEEENDLCEYLDFSEVVGQETMKRAMEVAVTGMHNILLVGPPGSGKTMLAKRLPGIMPPLSLEESMDISKIYSVSGLLGEQDILIKKRPFRCPHHTITATALVGGGRIPRPGEISLASGGVLFLDEISEFRRNTLEVLRQPLEERSIVIHRLSTAYRYPANFMLVAAMNPCNCGYYPDRNKCNCSQWEIKRYLGKLSQPLLDRIDLCTESESIAYDQLKKKDKGENSTVIRERVIEARQVQIQRYHKESIRFNGELTPRLIKKYCKLGMKEQGLLESIFQKMNLSVRSYHRILKVSRTIADMDKSQDIQCCHLSEAICYRSMNRNGQEGGL